MAVHTMSGTALKPYEGKWNGRWKGIEKLTKHTKISSKWKSRTIKRRNRRKYLKIWDDQIKQLIETKKKLINLAEFKETRRQTGIQNKQHWPKQT